MRRRALEAGRAIALPATPCPKAGGSRGSRAGRRPIPQGRAAPLTRGHAGPYQRPPPTRPRYAQHGRAIPLATGRVATTARIRRSPCEQPIDTLPRFKNVFGTARRSSTSREQRGATRSEQNWKPSRNRRVMRVLKVSLSTAAIVSPDEGGCSLFYRFGVRTTTGMGRDVRFWYSMSRFWLFLLTICHSRA